MPEATIEQIKGRNVITCDWVKLDGEELYWFNEWLPDYGGRHNLAGIILTNILRKESDD